jgi:hypothetical protein
MVANVVANHIIHDEVEAAENKKFWNVEGKSN